MENIKIDILKNELELIRDILKANIIEHIYSLERFKKKKNIYIVNNELEIYNKLFNCRTNKIEELSQIYKKLEG